MFNELFFIEYSIKQIIYFMNCKLQKVTKVTLTFYTILASTHVNNVNNKLSFSVSLNLNNWIMDVNDSQYSRLQSFWNFMKRSLNKKTIFLCLRIKNSCALEYTVAKLSVIYFDLNLDYLLNLILSRYEVCEQSVLAV